ncbi:MAG: M48 family metallopeptidase [Nanoarchaeota archaeon]|nr:M48 family metallopeptidase [Nanoarchaeota archaeon]
MSERIHFDDQIARNKRKSVFLMVIIFGVIIALGYVISYAFSPIYFSMIMIIAVIFSIGYVLISYYNSDKIALASVGAKEAKRSEYKQYYDAVEGLTIASGTPMPKLYVMNSEQINAFASGRNPKNSVICVTIGALKKLDKNELEGVLAHELSHISNFDIRFMTLTAVMVGMISIISQIFLRSFQFKNNDNKDNKLGGIFVLVGIVLAILAPIAVYFVQMAISRKREFTADATAVKITRYPVGLIRALKKIKEENKPEKKVNKAVAPLFFSDPFVNLTSTHPPIQKRIEVLERM